MNIVLMAGGGGTRLWPLSRQKNPKQFLDLGSGKTLLEQTYDRARAVVGLEHIFVATLEEYGERVRQMLPELPAANIFYEPDRRDTAPAFAAVAVQLQQLGSGDEVAVFMWSDHVFTAPDDFVADIKKIPDVLATHPDSIMIVGHVPTSAETGFGYIEAGELVEGYDDVWQVKSFKEKPDRAVAEKYVAAGNYYWNMGSVSLTPNYLLAQLSEFQPELFAGIQKYAKALEVVAYKALPRISIDYALLEKAPRIYVVTGDYGWSDIGNWAAVKQVFGVAGDHVPAGHHVHVDSRDNYVYNTTSKAVSLIGLQDTIVVVTDDAVLVTAKDKAYKIKEVVAKLEAEGKHQYL